MSTVRSLLPMSRIDPSDTRIRPAYIMAAVFQIAFLVAAVSFAAQGGWPWGLGFGVLGIVGGLTMVAIDEREQP